MPCHKCGHEFFWGNESCRRCDPLSGTNRLKWYKSWPERLFLAKLAFGHICDFIKFLTLGFVKPNWDFLKGDGNPLVVFIIYPWLFFLSVAAIWAAFLEAQNFMDGLWIIISIIILGVLPIFLFIGVGIFPYLIVLGSILIFGYMPYSITDRRENRERPGLGFSFLLYIPLIYLISWGFLHLPLIHDHAKYLAYRYIIYSPR